jgi:hypothetical protein
LTLNSAVPALRNVISVLYEFADAVFNRWDLLPSRIDLDSEVKLRVIVKQNKVRRARRGAAYRAVTGGFRREK